MPTCYKRFRVYSSNEQFISDVAYKNSYTHFATNKILSEILDKTQVTTITDIKFSLGPVVRNPYCYYLEGIWNKPFFPSSKIFALSDIHRVVCDSIHEELWECEYRGEEIKFGRRYIPSMDYPIKNFWENFKPNDKSYFAFSQEDDFYQYYVTGSKTILVDEIRLVQRIK
ncbi:MAG: hypothetical protein IPM51_11775 [Sphingobacteriaceae bacterium]|nr:hypothetical protein [Sphingobacteriaceae bacterium]